MKKTRKKKQRRNKMFILLSLVLVSGDVLHSCLLSGGRASRPFNWTGCKLTLHIDAGLPTLIAFYSICMPAVSDQAT